MGVLSDIETTLKNSDVSLIKTKLFTNLCRSGRSYATDSCVTFSFYELKKLDLSIDEIELLIQHGACNSHAVLGKIYPTCDIAIDFVSDLAACDMYMRDPAEFYKQHGVELVNSSKLDYTVLTSIYMEEKILSCMVVFDIHTQREYCKFRDTYLEKQWNTEYISPSPASPSLTGYVGANSSVLDMFYNYSFPPFK